MPQEACGGRQVPYGGPSSLLLLLCGHGDQLRSSGVVARAVAHQDNSPALIVPFHGDKLSLYVLCRSGWPWIYRDLMFASFPVLRLKACPTLTDNFLSRLHLESRRMIISGH